MRKNERIFVFSFEKWEFCQKLLIAPITILSCRGMALGGIGKYVGGIGEKWKIAKKAC